MGTNLEERNEITVAVLQTTPTSNERWHEHVNVRLVVHRSPDRVRQCPDRVVEDQQVLLLVLFESKHEVAEDRSEEWLELRAGLFFERRER